MLLAPSLGCGAFLFNACRSTQVVTGEEWSQSRSFNNEWLRPREDVLAEASRNIEKYRKGNLQINFRMGETPIVGQSIKIEMKDHYFDWGCSAIKRRSQFKSDDDYMLYMTQVRKVFNATTAKCYWDERWHQPIEKEEGKRVTDTFLAEAYNGYDWGMRVKGHPLVWTVPKAIPHWLKQYDTPRRLTILEAHVRDLVQKGGKAIHNWDVVNEMLWEPAFKNIDHRQWPHIDSINDIADYVAQALGWVQNENPGVKKLINNYGLIKDFIMLQSVKNQRKRYLQLLEALRARGIMPDAIGVQSHVGKWFEPDEIVQAYNELSQGGLPIHVTEFWANLKDCPHNIEAMSQVQKDQMIENYIQDFYTVAFGHPAVEHITYWGNPFFNAENRPTSYYHVLEALIREQWTTNGTWVTDSCGNITLNAFYGDYTVTLGNEQRTLSFTPSRSGLTTIISS